MGSELIVVPQYCRADFDTTKPYEWLEQFRADPFDYQRYTNMIAEQASNVGYKGFKNMLTYYNRRNSSRAVVMNNTVEYTDFPYFDTSLLQCGEWRCGDYSGVVGIDKRTGEEYQACPHPILPIERLINVDDGDEKITLAYADGTPERRHWKTVVVDKRIISSANKITELSARGILIDSERARLLVRFLTDFQALNRDIIPTRHSVGRLGWIKDYGFSPYIEDIQYDDSNGCQQYFDNVREAGDYQIWRETVSRVRSTAHPFVRVALAAAFASILVEPTDSLNFFVHFWGKSGKGKTVALMLAASVWANPALGAFARSFNSTGVGHEVFASFAGSLPVIIDELQIVKSKRDFDELIYQLAEGVGRTRGMKTGGLRKTASWHNCIITSGEFPITSQFSGGGAINRVIELNCNGIELFDNPRGVVGTLRKNYGHAGKRYAEYMTVPEHMDAVKDVYEQMYKSLSNRGITDKQRASAALLLTADKFAEEIIFQDGVHLVAEDLIPYLVTEKDVDQNVRALEMVYQYAASNMIHFVGNKTTEELSPYYGAFEDDYICIMTTTLNDILTENGFNTRSFLEYLKECNLISSGVDGKPSKVKSIHGQKIRCYCIKMPDDLCPEPDDDYLLDLDDLP